MKYYITIVTVLFSCQLLACQNIDYLKADTFYVTPRRAATERIRFIPFRGDIDKIKITSTEGLSIFDIKNPSIRYQVGREHDLRFRTNNDHLVADVPFKRAGLLVDEISLELRNTTNWVKIYDLYVGKCR